MTSKRRKIHTIFDCLDCEKRWENNRSAERLAKKHAEKYKHNVRGEIVIVVKYYGKKEE